MNTAEKMLFLSSQLMMLSLDKEQNAKEIVKVSEELAAMQRQMRATASAAPPDDEEISGFLEFTEKEILKMPKSFRKEFRTQGCTAHVRRRKSGKHSWNYEIRYRRNGYRVEASSNNLEVAKKKFIEKLNVADKLGPMKDSSVPTTFHEFAKYYFDTFWRRTVTELTYSNEMYRYNNHVKPVFGSLEIAKILPVHCQKMLDDIGVCKTGDEVYSILSKVFKSAIKHGIIVHNPLDLVVHIKHTRTHGKALTKEEERFLLKSLEGTKYQLLFAVVLYTGLRPNEYKSARIKGEFVVAINSKQRNGKIVYKKIPITPMLRPYLNGVTELNFPRVEYMRDKLKEILPNHKLYDLRTTFYTRCKECGVADVAIKTFVGHSLGGMADTYTDLSDDYLIEEGNKLKY